MMNCFKTELRTCFHLRVIVVCLLALFVIPITYFYVSYQAIGSQITYNQEVLNDVMNYADEIGSENLDYSDITDNLMEIYKTYHPKMAINNSLGIFVGIALIIFPVISSWYIGSEYGKTRTIKQKVTFYSLPKVFSTKIAIMAILIAMFTAFYVLACYIIASQKWPDISCALHAIDVVAYETIKYNSAMNNVVLFCVVVAILTFYSCFTMFLSGLLKGSTYGVIGVLVINYVVLPSKFAPHNVIYAMINQVFYTSGVSPYAFTQSRANALPVDRAAIFFILYFVILLGANFILSLRQKNY